MADKKVTELAAAGALDGSELVEAVQGGVNVQTTTQDIANLGGGGGAVTSVNGDTGAVVLAAGDIGFTPSGDIAATDVSGALNELDTEKQSVANKASNFTTINDTLYPSVQAVETRILESIAGLKWKESVRVATTVAGTLASSFENGDTVDGVVLATGNRILLKNQADQTVNGIYTINASGAPTRSTDADAAAELEGAAVSVQEGTSNANTTWIQTTDGITLGSSNIVWSAFGTSVADADATTKGIARLYPSTSLGTNTDGAPDQNAVKTYVDDKVSWPLETFATALTFDFSKDLETISGGATTFTLAGSGHLNGVEIVARIDRPLSVAFPAGFEAVSGSDEISTSSMNIIWFRYFEDYDGDGNDKVLYIVKAQETEAAYDTDYQAVLDRGTTLGYTLPSVPVQAKQNSLVLALKAAGVWTLLDVFYVFAQDGSAEFGTLNWKAPTLNQATRIAVPIWVTNQGFFGNGTSSYVNLNFTPSTQGVNFTQNDGSFLVHVFGNSAATATGHGTRNGTGTNSTTITPRFTGNVIFSRLNSTTGFSSSTNSDAIGTYHAKRTSSTAVAVFKNGVSFGTASATSEGRSSVPVFVEAINDNGTAGFFTSRGVSMAGLGASLNGLELAFHSAWNTYFTSL